MNLYALPAEHFGEAHRDTALLLALYAAWRWRPRRRSTARVERIDQLKEAMATRKCDRPGLRES
jgi:hypothetical protein